jgi:hypothetical protein
MKRRILAGLLLCVLGASTWGCSTVKPYQREYLANRIMDPATRMRENLSDRKWLSTREGALGGDLGAGGGCACN